MPCPCWILVTLAAQLWNMKPTIAAVRAMTRLIKDMANPPSNPSMPTSSGMNIITVAAMAMMKEVVAYRLGGLLLTGCT